jgi:hypothetical protein
MFGFLRSMLELFGIVFLRFRMVPRIWCVWLVGVNLACLMFLPHPEAVVVLATTGVAVVAQTLLYGRMGFTRVMGVTHLLWLPMFAWMAFRLDAIAADPALQQWLILLLATNCVSLIVDLTDVTRFVRGERTPHYAWRRPAPGG